MNKVNAMIDDVMNDNERLSEWFIEYVLADMIPANVIASRQENNRWTVTNHHRHVRSERVHNALAELLCSGTDAQLLDAARRLKKDTLEAFEDRAEDFVDRSN